MKKILLLIILGSLVTSCKTTNPNDSIVTNNKVKSIKVVVEYYGDLTGENIGSKLKQTPTEKENGTPLKYTIDMDISSDIRMMDFISAFHKKTGLDSSYPMSGGAPPHRHTTQISYYHEVNGIVLNPDNAKSTLTEWNIQNNSTVVIEVAGGGAID